MARKLSTLLLLGVLGCVPGTTQTELVPSNPFTGGAVAVQPPKPVASPATEEASLRVLKVGQKVLAANPQLGVKPYFSTIGTSTTGPPADEIFHTGSNQVVITETLVHKCRTDGQLAAVLCVELAKMAGEQNQASTRADDAGPPADVPVGSEVRGTFGPADGTRAVELAKYDRSHRRGIYAVPDPSVLARSYLAGAGFAAGDFDAAAPLLRAAERNVTLEKQMSR